MTADTAIIPTLGPRLFSFGVITDTHVNQGEDDCNSPYEANRLANRRMRHVIRDLNTRDLAFVVNVGDLVHPVPAISDLYARAAGQFHDQVKDLKHPLYLTPGNHDVGDKPNDWAPAARVHEDYLALWDEHFGAQYQSLRPRRLPLRHHQRPDHQFGLRRGGAATGLAGSRPGGQQGQAHLPAQPLPALLLGPP